MNKFTVQFITKYNQKFNLDMTGKNKQDVLNQINRMVSQNVRTNFIGNETHKYINLNEVVYFEIKGGK